MKQTVIILALAALLLFVLAVVTNQYKHIKLSGWLLAACIMLLGVIADRVYIWLTW